MIVDTLTIARELKAAELPGGQAEAIASAIGKAVAETSATKTDLELVKQELKGEIERASNKLLIWVVSTQVAIGGLIVALVKL